VEQKPSVGRIVHYQSHGSPDGTYKSEPRAAIITDVNTNPETNPLAVSLDDPQPGGPLLRAHRRVRRGRQARHLALAASRMSAPLEHGVYDVETFATHLAQTAGADREQIIATIRQSLSANAAPASGPELRVLIVGAPVTANHAYAPVAFKLKTTGKWVARIRLTEEGEAYRRKIHGQMLASRMRVRDWPLDADRYAVHIVWHFASHSCDLDGPLKLALDALGKDRDYGTVAVYPNDNRVGHLVVDKYVDRANPRVEITVRPMLGALPRQETLFGARQDRSAG
jgi:Holliday junction resolvase RusA-like endonuclease